jgi:hypothetical protein
MLSRKRARTVPTSCADLDLDAVGLELIRTCGNVRAAARALGVPMRNLRLLVDARPELLDAALESAERALDEAEAVLIKAMRQDDDAIERLRAARFYLRASPAGRRRGFW